jgi:hypothetical protein
MNVKEMKSIAGPLFDQQTNYRSSRTVHRMLGHRLVRAGLFGSCLANVAVPRIDSDHFPPRAARVARGKCRTASRSIEGRANLDSIAKIVLVPNQFGMV